MAEHGRLPVVNFAAGGIATPADAALMMHLGTYSPSRSEYLVCLSASCLLLWYLLLTTHTFVSGMDGVFVGSGIFKSGNPDKRAKAIVRAVAHYNDPKVLAEVSVSVSGRGRHLLRGALFQF